MGSIERDSAGRSIDFLGYEFTHDNMRMRKSMKKNFAHKIDHIRSRKRRHEILAAYWGWCKYGRCKHLWKILTNNDMSFADKGIKMSGRTKEGKKFFDVQSVRLMEILNVPITIIDYESGVSTKQGEDRYCVLFERDGERGKFITNCFNLKDVLDQARKMEIDDVRVFPVENVVIKRRSLGDGKSAYYFD